MLLYNYLFLFAVEEIINPLEANKSDNPINYEIILNSDSVEIEGNEALAIIIREKKTLFTSCDSFAQPLLFIKDNSQEYFLLADNKYYRLIPNEKGLRISPHLNLSQDYYYIGFIATKNNNEPWGSNSLSCSTIANNEVIIYGKNESLLYFYFTLKQHGYSLNCGITQYDDVSCKQIKDIYFICVFSGGGKITLKVLTYNCLENGENVIGINYSYEIKESNHEKAILYDTTNI